MKKNWILFLIITAALLLRLWGLDKPLGLWNDEYMAWWISSFEFGKPLFHKIFLNCHMPLYYLFLKAWCALFGNADLSLRMSSVITGIFCIVSMYFLGKEYNGAKTGITCALFTSLSGFMIYFSQEVRPYSLIFLISAWIAFFFIKSLKTFNRLNFSMYILANFILLCTHTIGFVYVFFNLLVFSIIISKNNPSFKKIIYKAYAVLAVLFIPLGIFVLNILTRVGLSQNWGCFNFSKLFFVFSDYFTPVQLNLVNSPLNLVSYLSSQNIFSTILYFFIPAAIALFFILKTIKEKEPVLQALGLISLFYFAALTIAALTGKMVFTTKYSVELYPVLILYFVNGIYSLPNRLPAKSLSIIYFSITVIYLIFNANAPQKLPRTEGHKAPAILLEQAQIAEDDYVISLYHQFFRYEKYIKTKPQNIINVDKGSVAAYLFGEKRGEKDIIFYGKSELREPFSGNGELEIIKRIDSVYKNIPPGKKISIIVPTQAAFLSSNDLKRITKDDKEYDNAEIMFLTFSYAKIKFINEAFKFCNFLSMDELGSWVVITFVKK